MDLLKTRSDWREWLQLVLASDVKDLPLPGKMPATFDRDKDAAENLVNLYDTLVPVSQRLFREAFDELFANLPIATRICRGGSRTNARRQSDWLHNHCSKISTADNGRTAPGRGPSRGT